MATTTATAPEQAVKPKINIYIGKLLDIVNDNVGSFVVTIVIFGISAATYFTINPAHSAWAIAITFFIYLDLLAIRITRYFDDSYTLNELADRIIEAEESNNQRLEKIERNL